MQRGIADMAGGADFAEQRSGLSLGDRLPGLERPHRAGLDMFAPRQADLGPLPRRVGLAPRDPDAQPAGGEGHVLDLQRHQLGTA